MPRLDLPPEFEIVAVALVDMRATVEAIRRNLTSAQSSVEQHRHIRSKATLADIDDCITDLTHNARALTDIAADARKAVDAVIIGIMGAESGGREHLRPQRAAD